MLESFSFFLLDSHSLFFPSFSSVSDLQRTKKIQLAEESIASEQKYQTSLKALLDLADTEEEKQNTTGQLEESVRKISGLKKDLERAKTTQETDDSLVGEELQFREFNGHRYKVTTFDMDVHCQQCGEHLAKRQGLFCLTCGEICHKECHTLDRLSCADRVELKTIPPLIFQTLDAEERKKWVEGINSIRENYLKNNT